MILRESVYLALRAIYIYIFFCQTRNFGDFDFTLKKVMKNDKFEIVAILH